MKRISERSIHITEIISAVIVLITGIFLMLSGLEVFGFGIEKCWLMCVYVCMFTIFLTVTVAEKNSIGACLACIFGLLAISELLIMLGYTHRTVYPIYIAALPLGLACTSLLSKHARALTAPCLAVAGGAALLILESTNVLPLGVALPIVAVYFAVLGIIYTCFKSKKAKEIDKKENI